MKDVVYMEELSLDGYMVFLKYLPTSGDNSKYIDRAKIKYQEIKKKYPNYFDERGFTVVDERATNEMLTYCKTEMYTFIPEKMLFKLNK